MTQDKPNGKKDKSAADPKDARIAQLEGQVTETKDALAKKMGELTVAGKAQLDLLKKYNELQGKSASALASAAESERALKKRNDTIKALGDDIEELEKKLDGSRAVSADLRQRLAAIGQEHSAKLTAALKDAKDWSAEAARLNVQVMVMRPLLLKVGLGEAVNPEEVLDELGVKADEATAELANSAKVGAAV